MPWNFLRFMLHMWIRDVKPAISLLMVNNEIPQSTPFETQLPTIQAEHNQSMNQTVRIIVSYLD